MNRRFALSTLAAPFAAFAAEWPGWRGPSGDGVLDLPGLPLEWSTTRNVAWKTPVVGRGHSSPVIWGNRIFLTTSIESAEKAEGAKPVRHKFAGEDPFVHPQSVGGDRKYTLKVLCLDRAAGKILWERTAYEGLAFDARHQKNSYATPTPVTDGKYVYVSFESQGVYCYGLRGALAWKASFGGVATVGMGPGTSPVLAGGNLIFVLDQDMGENSFIAALDARTGKEKWRVRRENRVTWSTPLVVESRSGKQLIVPGSEAIVSYDPATGKERWRGPALEGNAVPSPVAGHGMVYVMTGHPNKLAYALRIDHEGTPESRVVWQHKKGTGYVPSPVLYSDYLYVLEDRGLLTCLDAKTGKVMYEGKRVPDPGWFRASLAAYDGKILMSSEEGDYYVIKAGPEFEVLAKNSLEEGVYASPAMHSDSLYLRTVGHLYRIRKQS
ncbi:MAG: PQQ-like beta-propeller repeat protein [Bryobacterales bacterium]|nr:PQQ-like beta-propeller repeat protein [Bryobacterales bacterium]